MLPIESLADHMERHITHRTGISAGACACRWICQRQYRGMLSPSMQCSANHVWEGLLLPCRALNVADVLARVFLPRRWRFGEDAMSEESTERGRVLLRQEQALAHTAPACLPACNACLAGSWRMSVSIAAACHDLAAALGAAARLPRKRARTSRAFKGGCLAWTIGSESQQLDTWCLLCGRSVMQTCMSLLPAQAGQGTRAGQLLAGDSELLLGLQEAQKQGLAIGSGLQEEDRKGGSSSGDRPGKKGAYANGTLAPAASHRQAAYWHWHSQLIAM